MSCCNGNSIMNRTPSLIGAPVCVPNCPPSGYGCPDIIMSDCVVFTGNNAPIVNVYNGDTFTTVIQNITNSITEIIQGSTPCSVWNNIGPSGTVGDGNFVNGWANADFSSQPLQVGGYTNPLQCKVSLRGLVKGLWGLDPTINYTMFVLPVGYRPAFARVFSTTIYIEDTLGQNYEGNTIAAFILVRTTGEVSVYWNGKCCSTTIISQDEPLTSMRVTLEGVSFEIA